MAENTIVLRISGAKARKSFALNGIDYAAGDTLPDLNFSDREYHTRPDDVGGSQTYPPRLNRNIEIDRSAQMSGDGDPIELGGFAMPKILSRVVVDNGDGKFNWLRWVGVDGCTARIFEIPNERDPTNPNQFRPVLQSDPSVITHFVGSCAGAPEVNLDDSVEFELVDKFDDRLSKPLQVKKYLGLGGRIEFDGTGSGRASVPHSSALNVSVFTWIFLYSHDGSGNAGSVLAKSDTDTTAAAFNVRCIASPIGTLRCRVNVTSGSTNAVDIVIPTNTPRWVIFSWNGSTISVQQANQDGTGLTAATTAALSGTLRTTANPLEFGWSNVAGTADCELSELRFYNRVLSTTEISGQLGRPLDVESSTDTNGLVGYWDCNERALVWLTNQYPAGGANDANLTGTYIWGSTLTGDPSQAGQYMPLLFGASDSLALTKIDDPLEYWQVSATTANQISRGFNAQLAGLTPTFAVTTGWVLTIINGDTATLERTGGGLIIEFVPGMNVTLGTGWVANSTKVLTVTAIKSTTVVRVSRFSGAALVNETAASALVTASSPQWVTMTRDGNTYVRLLSDQLIPPIFRVQGENGAGIGYSSTLGAIIYRALKTSDAAILDSEYTADTLTRLTGGGTGYAAEIMAMPASFFAPASEKPVTVKEFLEAVAFPVGLYVTSLGGLLEINAIELSTAKPSLSLVDEEVEDLKPLTLRRPPPLHRKIRYRIVDYQPPLDSISAGAIPAVADLVRQGGLLYTGDSLVPAISTIWPTAGDDDDAVETRMRFREGAIKVFEYLEGLGENEICEMRIMADRPLEIGSAIEIFSGDPDDDFEHSTGFEDGLSCTVVKLQKDISDRHYVIRVLAPFGS